jgi:hypothetical protein
MNADLIDAMRLHARYPRLSSAQRELLRTMGLCALEERSKPTAERMELQQLCEALAEPAPELLRPPGSCATSM